MIYRTLRWLGFPVSPCAHPGGRIVTEEMIALVETDSICAVAAEVTKRRRRCRRCGHIFPGLETVDRTTIQSLEMETTRHRQFQRDGIYPLTGWRRVNAPGGDER